MRVSVNLFAKNLPILYRHCFVSLIEETLVLSDSDYESMLYPEDSKRTKPFSFSVYIPPGFATSKEKFIINLYSCLLRLKEFEIVEGEVTFKTMSPISVGDEHGKPIELFSEGFVDESSLEIFRGFGLKGTCFHSNFIPNEDNEKVVERTLKDFRDQRGKPFMTLTT